ncbi:MAG: hypothetical protein ACP5N3_05255 [Candidatus Nanoarchaeia archaeon]
MKTFKGFMAMAALYFLISQGAAAQETKWYSKQPTDAMYNFRKNIPQEVASGVVRPENFKEYVPDSSLTALVDSLQLRGVPVIIADKYSYEMVVEGRSCRIDVVGGTSDNSVIITDNKIIKSEDASADSIKNSLMRRENLRPFLADSSLTKIIDSLQIQGVPIIFAKLYGGEIAVGEELQKLCVLGCTKNIDEIVIDYMIIRTKSSKGKQFSEKAFPDCNFEESYYFDGDLKDGHLNAGVDANFKKTGFDMKYKSFFRGVYVYNEPEKTNDLYYLRLTPIKLELEKENAKLLKGK